jgi:hypothetical protein
MKREIIKSMLGNIQSSITNNVKLDVYIYFDTKNVTEIIVKGGSEDQRFFFNEHIQKHPLMDHFILTLEKDSDIVFQSEFLFHLLNSFFDISSVYQMICDAIVQGIIDYKGYVYQCLLSSAERATEAVYAALERDEKIDRILNNCA